MGLIRRLAIQLVGGFILGKPPHCFVVSLVVAGRLPNDSRNTTEKRTVRRFLASGSSSEVYKGVQRGVKPLRNHCFGMGSIYLGSKLRGKDGKSQHDIGGIGLQNGMV